jgi:hypothetical protein
MGIFDRFKKKGPQHPDARPDSTASTYCAG